MMPPLTMRGWAGEASWLKFSAGIFVLGMLNVTCLKPEPQGNFQDISFTSRMVMRKKGDNGEVVRRSGVQVNGRVHT